MGWEPCRAPRCVGAATLEADGSVQLTNGPRLKNSTLHGFRNDLGIVDVSSKDGQTVVEVRDGKSQNATLRYKFDGSDWYEFAGSKRGELLVNMVVWAKKNRGVVLAGGMTIIVLIGLLVPRLAQVTQLSVRFSMK